MIKLIVNKNDYCDNIFLEKGSGKDKPNTRYLYEWMLYVLNEGLYIINAKFR